MSQKFRCRRDFLKQLGLASSAAALLKPMDAFAAALNRNLMAGARAEAAGEGTSIKYLNIYLSWSPMRTSFDQWLRTNPSDPAVLEHTTLGNAFVYNSSSGAISDSEYRTFNYKGMLIPHLFSTFSQTDQDALLNEFLVIRGYGTQVDGHPINRTIQTLPMTGAPSISGLLADFSDKYFQAIQFPNRLAGYSSEKSIPLNQLGMSGNPLNKLFTPLASDTSARAVRQRYHSYFSAIRSQLNGLKQESKTAEIAHKSLDSAYALFQAGSPDISKWWVDKVLEYKTVAEAAMRSNSIPGLNVSHDMTRNLSLLSDGSPKFRTDTHTWANGHDMIATNAAVSLSDIFEGLAMAEYCFLNGYSSVAEVTVGAITNLMKDPNGGLGPANLLDMFMDQHDSGCFPTVYFTSLYFRGLIAILLHFKKMMSAGGQWKQTIVQIQSEFGRSVGAYPLYGSDHLYDGMISSIFSGVINGGPYVVGNVRQKGRKGENYTEGIGSRVEGYPQSGIPTPIAMTSTVSELMGLGKNPWSTQAPPLIKLSSDGSLIYPFGKGKLVAED